MKYSMKDVCNHFNIPSSTIRYYESLGIIPVIKRERNIRVFDDHDFYIIQIAQCLKKTGMSISDMTEFMQLYQQGPSTVDRRIEIFKEHEQHILHKIEEYNLNLEILRRKMKTFNKLPE